MSNWKDLPRNDLNMIPQMNAAGWTAIFSYSDISYRRITPDNPPHHDVSFQKNNQVIWKVRDGWMIAELIDGYYCGHKRFESLEMFTVDSQ